ncbi:DMT family transporter [Pelagibius marinus]|uniref:DMT family transporter n=1 Tax=Pelagibius marinus TaxID=2762760 RepID=UPI001872B7DB|nr:DMT family transporter [Pelagibius marinus]
MSSDQVSSPQNRPTAGGASPLVAALLLTISSACWGGNIFIGRAVHAEVPPVGLSFWRWVLALAILLPFAWPRVRRDLPEIRRHWKNLAAFAFFGMAAFHTSLYLSVNYTTATNAALLVAICPVLVPLLSWALYREPITPRILLAIAVSLAGVTVVILRGDLAHLRSLTVNKGDFIMLAAVFFWSMYTVLVKRRPATLHPQSLLAATMALAIAMLLPVYLWEHAFVRPMPLTQDSLLTIVYVVFFASLLAFFCFNRGIEVLGPNKGGLFMHLIPVFAALLAFVFLGERLEGFHAVGIAAIVTGIVLATTARSGAKPAPGR